MGWDPWSARNSISAGITGSISHSHLLGMCPNISGEAELLQEQPKIPAELPCDSQKNTPKSKIFPSAAQLRRAAVISACFKQAWAWSHMHLLQFLEVISGFSQGLFAVHVYSWDLTGHGRGLFVCRGFSVPEQLQNSKEMIQKRFVKLFVSLSKVRITVITCNDWHSLFIIPVLSLSWGYVMADLLQFPCKTTFGEVQQRRIL